MFQQWDKQVWQELLIKNGFKMLSRTNDCGFMWDCQEGCNFEIITNYQGKIVKELVHFDIFANYTSLSQINTWQLTLQNVLFLCETSGKLFKIRKTSDRGCWQFCWWPLCIRIHSPILPWLLAAAVLWCPCQFSLSKVSSLRWFCQHWLGQLRLPSPAWQCTPWSCPIPWPGLPSSRGGWSCETAQHISICAGKDDYGGL